VLLNNRKGLDALLAEYGSSAKALPEIAGCYAGGRLVIAGDASCVWTDLEAFGCRLDEGKGLVAKDGWHFMAVNKIGETFPGDLEHWYSNAPHLLNRWKAARRVEYDKEFKPPRHLHSCQPGVTWLWPWPALGTSGLGATMAGLGLGYSEIMLCGMPLDDGPHNGEPHWRGTKFSKEAPDGLDGGPELHWRRAIDCAFQGRVRSMSGRTREWLGE
jgi:hypothetical protein